MTWLEVRFPEDGGGFISSEASGVYETSYLIITGGCCFEVVERVRRQVFEAEFLLLSRLKIRGALPRPGDIFLI